MSAILTASASGTGDTITGDVNAVAEAIREWFSPVALGLDVAAGFAPTESDEVLRRDYEAAMLIADAIETQPHWRTTFYEVRYDFGLNVARSPEGENQWQQSQP